MRLHQQVMSPAAVPQRKLAPQIGQVLVGAERDLSDMETM